ncbi:Stealth protein CR4, conserved region 4 [Brevibacterium sp. Mu109]|nr:Stealth protein CR4, conserved region 4 [Brevibacterium sp. Mu109]
MRLSPSAVRSIVASKLTPERKLWLSRLRHGELSWQRRTPAPAVRKEIDEFPGYDARRMQDLSLRAVRDALTNASVQYVELPRLSHFGPTLVVCDSQSAAALAAVAGLLSSRQRWTIRCADARGHVVSARRARGRPQALAAVECRRRWIAANGRDLTTPAEAVTIEFWEELGAGVPRADGSVHLPGTLRRRQNDGSLLLEYIEPKVWSACVSDDSVLGLPAPHLDALNEPVDIVYTWVDGDDPRWRQRMVAARDERADDGAEVSSTAESRFTSRDELRYSLRSLEYYASWARHVYIVTDGQAPSWLDTSNPRVTVVDHREIFSDPRVLPVFNSHAIESQLHHIPGLSDRYLYLNDDVLFLRPTDPELFFTGSGLAKHFPSTVPLDIGGQSVRDLPVMSAAKRGREHLIQRYQRTVTQRFKHTPHAQLRRVLETMEAECPELFAEVASSPFRSPHDVSIPSSLHHFDAAMQGLSVEGRIGYQFIDLASHDLALRLSRAARRTDLDVVCLNETTIPPQSEETIDALVGEFLEDRFPVPSSFELVPTGRLG